MNMPSFRRGLTMGEQGGFGRFRFDRRIPLSLLLTLGLQVVAFTYFMGKLSTRVDHLEQSDAYMAAHFADFDQGRLVMRERVAKVETSLAGISELLIRMDAKLDRLQEQRAR